MLPHHIRHIIGRCAKKQMRWITARRIIAAVADKKVPRNGVSEALLEHQSVHSQILASEGNRAVASTIAVSLAFPAFIGFSNWNARPQSA